eukprot:9050942-Ditylum_brightwellii.AAC.1
MHDLPDDAQNTIEQCMDIDQSGMKSMLIQFCGKYYVYKGAAGDEKVAYEDVGLIIGACKLAFLAKIVASYVFELREKCFRES